MNECRTSNSNMAYIVQGPPADVALHCLLLCFACKHFCGSTPMHVVGGGVTAVIEMPFLQLKSTLSISRSHLAVIYMQKWQQQFVDRFWITSTHVSRPLSVGWESDLPYLGSPASFSLHVASSASTAF